MLICTIFQFIDIRILENLGFKKGYCEEAENHFKEVISLPIFSGLRKQEQKFVIESIKEIYKK